MQKIITKYSYNDTIMLVLILALYLFADKTSLLFGQFLILLAIFQSIQLIYRYKEYDFLVVFLIFGILYWFFLIPFYYFSIPYHYVLEYQTVENTNYIVLLQIIFLRVMFFNINPNYISILKYKYTLRKNNFIYYTLFFLLIVMIPISMVLTPPPTGKYSIDTQSSIWFEYVIIFIIIIYIYSDTKVKQYYVFFISSIYAFIPLLYGKRGTFLMVFFVIFNLFLSGKLKFKQIILSIIVLFILFRMFTSYRTGTEISFLSTVFGVAFDDKTTDMYLSNNQGGVIVCSVTYFAMIQNGIFDIYFSLKSLLGTILSIVLPSSVNLEETFINTVTLKYANIPGNGGLSSIYLYIWGGLSGVFIGAGLFNMLLRKMSSSRLVNIYLIFIFATYPRWYAYNMFVLLKMGFWLMLFLAIADTYHKSTRKGNIK